MKKLLILASALALGLTVNAANAIWGMSSDASVDRNGNYLGDPGAAAGYLYLYLGTVTQTAAGDGYTLDFSGTTLLTSGGQNGDFSFGNANSGTYENFTGLSSTAAGQAYTLIMAEDSSADLTQAGAWYYLETGTSGQGVNPMDATDTWATMASGTAIGSSSWSQTAVVPEPTSGLLLLLGMAGLALKRKRA